MAAEKRPNFGTLQNFIKGKQSWSLKILGKLFWSISSPVSEIRRQMASFVEADPVLARRFSVLRRPEMPIFGPFQSNQNGDGAARSGRRRPPTRGIDGRRREEANGEDRERIRAQLAELWPKR